MRKNRREEGIRAMWVFLTSVSTEIEADILIGLLEQESFPTQKIYPGIGNLKATYGLMSGVDIYVPKDLLLQAKDLIVSSLEASSFSESDDYED